MWSLWSLLNMNKIEHCWITLNRQCNLRCKWCYAASTNYIVNNDMNFNLAKKIIDLAKDLSIEEIALIGGEPTCYDNLDRVISYAKEKEIKPWLVTNGLKLKNNSYLENLIKCGLTGINFSFKGWSQQSYIDNTGIDAFEPMIKALNNVCNHDVLCKASYVISKENIDHLLEIVKIARDCGVNNYYFSLEHDFSKLDGKTTIYDINSINVIVNKFSEMYPELNTITNGNFILHQSLPICLWNKEIIDQLTENEQIYTSCSLLRRSGIFFDTDGALIPCNAMYQTPLGKFDVDFSDFATFNSFWNSKKIEYVYNKLKELPSTKCRDCINVLNCGGGCIANWFHYTYDDLVKYNIVKQN